MAGESFGRVGEKIVVDVWSDVMCPFCYLGDKHLELALEAFEHRDRFEVRYRSFLLMPELTADTKMDLDEMLSAKHGMPLEQAAEMNAQFAERGAPVGLDYRMDDAIATSTRDAHRLSHLAAEHGRQHEMVIRLFKAYFTDGMLISDHEVLANLAEEVGLDRAEALAALVDGRFADEVDADIDQARQLGIRGVPFFVFDGRFAVSGAQPVEGFTKALRATWDERAAQAATS